MGRERTTVQNLKVVKVDLRRRYSLGAVLCPALGREWSS
jgi:ribosomal protein L3